MSSSSEIVGSGVMRVERDNGGGGNGRNGRREKDSRRFCPHPGPMTIRYVYTGLFLVANVLAWAVREEHVTFFEGQRLHGCQGHRDCLAVEGVLITSLTSFLFFIFMFFSTMYTRKLQDHRNSWHCRWWPAKIVLLAGCIMVSTFTPSYWIQLYGEVAPFGAGMFLFVQLLSVIRYITRLNTKWCHTNFTNHYLKVIVLSTIAYGGSMVSIILMSMWYTGCRLNTAFIGTTLLMVCLMPLISLKSKAKGFYMEPGLVGAYSVFMCYSAIRSEPETHCYKKEKADAGANWKTMISFVGELISIAASAFSTGKDYKCIQLRNVAVLEDDVPYGYGFFHFVFAMGSMYFGMLFVGWDDTHHIMEMWSMDVGWTSAWVHVANEGLAIVSFVAVLAARIYGIGWLQQLLGRIFGIGGQQQQQQEEAERRDILSGSNGGDDDNASRAPPPPPLAQTTTTVELDDSNDIHDDTAAAGPPPSPVSNNGDDDELRNENDAPPAPDNNHADAAAGPSNPAAACATAGLGRRRLAAGNWRRIRLSRRLILILLCVHVICFICFTCLYMYVH